MSASRMLNTLKAVGAQLSGLERLAALGSMASCATHTLCQPLAGVKESRKAGRRAFIRDEGATALAEIMAPNRPLDLWVHGLLSYLRPLDRYRAACNVNQLIEDALSVLEPQRAMKEVEIALQLAPLPRLAADPLWLGQAFLAILTDVLDTSTYKQCIVISSEANEAFVSVSIASGVWEASQALLPKGFGHTELGRSEKVGLGLTMAQRIVEAHRGHMALHSRAALDTIVIVRLPLLAPPLHS